MALQNAFEGLAVESKQDTLIAKSTAIASSASVAGTSMVKVLSAATANPFSVKASAGRLYGYQLINRGSKVAYVKLYNSASTPTAGSGTVVAIIPLPPLDQTSAAQFTVPITFSTGIGLTIVGGAADNDSTAVEAHQVVGYLLYA